MGAPWKPWAEAPKDGTVFSFGNFCRWNTVDGRWEVLVLAEDGCSRQWAPYNFRVPPTLWLDAPYTPVATTWTARYVVTFKRVGLWRSLLRALAFRVSRDV